MRLSVFGTGYLGATHAACMAELGHEVLGIDVDETKISRLSTGMVPFHEPGLPDLLRKHVESGRLRFTTDHKEAAEFADLHFIAVGTPQKVGEYAADTSFVEEVVTSLVPLLRQDSAIVGKSTVPVGTASHLQTLADGLVEPGVSCEILWNPEFLREGFALKDTLEPDRIVMGVSHSDGRAERMLRECYSQILERPDGCPLIVTDLPTSELVKVSANAFLATKISFINAVSEVCEAAGADVTVLADAIGMDDRIGRKFLGAGLGFGGGCLPKDIRAFMARAGELGADQALTFLREVDTINVRRRQHTVNLALQLTGRPAAQSRVAILGAAFKPDSDDVRDSPALDVAAGLSARGVHVTVFDPAANPSAKAVFPNLDYAESAVHACRNADLVLVATEWQEFRELDPTSVSCARGRILLDARNCMPSSDWITAGWTYRALGRSNP